MGIQRKTWKRCIWYVYDMYMICIWYVYDMYMICIWYVYDMYVYVCVDPRLKSYKCVDHRQPLELRPSCLCKNTNWDLGLQKYPPKISCIDFPTARCGQVPPPALCSTSSVDVRPSKTFPRQRGCRTYFPCQNKLPRMPRTWHASVDVFCSRKKKTLNQPPVASSGSLTF